MKAIIFENYGAPGVLKLSDVPKPVPKADEVIVNIHCTTVTSGDVRLRKADPWLSKFIMGFPKPKKKILGVDFAGVVDSTGSSVTKFKIGDRVFGSSGFNPGTYAEFKAISENGIISKIPGNITFEEAAAIPFGGLTSLHFLKQAGELKGKKVLIYGASGSLGTAAVQLAKFFGAVVTGVCSSKNRELVLSLGAANVFDYNKDDFSKKGVKYDVVYDTVGKTNFENAVLSLNENGLYLRAVHFTPSPVFKAIWTELTTSKKVIGGVTKETVENLEFIANLTSENKYKPVIDRIYPFEEISAAHAYVETGRKKGNVVIVVDDDLISKASNKAGMFIPQTY
ncbi:MAG: NAD(P)-dependent alcohol dehydrogenase [Ignavibacteriaceae bacterium]|nr:NAD(P)-dependent alcohol dehydrogenase [Ignavibacteriaceae bacterium]